MSHDTSALVWLTAAVLAGVLGYLFVFFGGVRRLLGRQPQLGSTVKGSRESLLIQVDYWASGAIYMGAGYWFLSQVSRGIAVPIALSLLIVGFIVRLVLHARRKSGQ
jgi:hypothetical protein